MNDTETEPSLTEILTRESQPDESPPTPGDVSLFPCSKCGKEFKSGPAIRMHTIRMHGKGWSTSQNFFKRKRMVRGKPVQTEEERLANKRAYNRRYRLRKGMAAKPERFKENKEKRKVGGYKGMAMPKWSLARRRKFNARRSALLNHTLEPAKPKPSAVVQSVTFCPRCGCNIEVVRKAIEFADRV